MCRLPSINDVSTVLPFTQAVIVVTTIKLIITWPAVYFVIAITSEQLVLFLSADKIVIPVFAIDFVIILAPLNSSSPALP